jgi:hypothetical protein
MLIVSHFKTLSFFQWKQLLTQFGVIGISMKSIGLRLCPIDVHAL